MYYRGLRSSSEKTQRPSSRETTYGVRWKTASRQEGKDSKSFFLNWENRKTASPTGAEAAPAFYRRGRTPAEDGPGFFERKRAWAPKPLLGAANRILKGAGLAVLVLLVVWSKNKTTSLLQDVAGLKLERVSVDGNHYLTEDEIVKAAALPLGESMFKLDLKQALERVRALGWADRVFIERRLPRSIVISVRERKPLALLDNGTLYGVDREGRVLSPSSALLREDLPLISGITVPPEAAGTTTLAESLKPALDFFASLEKEDKTQAQNVSEVNLSEPGSLKVTFIDGVQATFEPPVEATAFRRMALVEGELNRRGKRAATMDFRYQDLVLVKTR
jgi:cell division protein FtsQ